METMLRAVFITLLVTGIPGALAGPPLVVSAADPPPPDPSGYGTRWVYIPDGEGVPRVAWLVPGEGEEEEPAMGRSGPEEEVVFKLYTRKNPQEGQRLFVNSSESLDKSNFDETKPTRFVVHGWMSSTNSTTVTNIRDAYLSVEECNIVAVDWSLWAASSLYWYSKASVPEVGRRLGQLAATMARRGADARRMHFVGHSLGAHVAGQAGSELARSARGARVTGLDPALPGFQYYEYAEGRLDESDGEFVAVIHTCAGALGYTSPIGHADFYPNNGTPMQPGCCCLPEVVQACSHARAHEYFAESITSKTGFWAVSCDRWEDFQAEKCGANQAILMGEHTPRSARGSYFLATNSTSPYALGLAPWMKPMEE